MQAIPDESSLLRDGSEFPPTAAASSPGSQQQGSSRCLATGEGDTGTRTGPITVSCVIVLIPGIVLKGGRMFPVVPLHRPVHA